MAFQHVGDEDRGRAVRRADDGDGGRIPQLKAEQARHRQREEDAELRRRAEEQQLRIGQQRAEIDHRADADKQQQREKLVRHARLKQGFQHFHRAGVRQVAQDAAKAHRQQQRRLHLLADSQIDHHAADDPHRDHLPRQRAQVAPNLRHRFFPPFPHRVLFNPMIKRISLSCKFFQLFHLQCLYRLFLTFNVFRHGFVVPAFGI